MSKDPEVESIAGRAAWRAHRTYDPSRNVPWKRWVARITRMAVWYYWRERAKLREENPTEMWWEEVYVAEPRETDIELDRDDFRMLCESFVEKWPADVIARRYNVPTATMRRMLEDAENRFLAAMRARDDSR